MANSGTSTGICLHGLPAREEAVVKRVISFSGTQGRNFTLSAMADADILVLADETEVDFTAMNPAGCMIIRIAEPGTERAYDVLMQRPLLVTKVMRTLDDANTLLKSSQQESEAGNQGDQTAAADLSSAVGPDSAGTAVEAKVDAGVDSKAVPESPAGEKDSSAAVQQPEKPALSLYAQLINKAKAAKAAAERESARQAKVPEQDEDTQGKDEELSIEQDTKQGNKQDARQQEVDAEPAKPIRDEATPGEQQSEASAPTDENRSETEIKTGTEAEAEPEMGTSSDAGSSADSNAEAPVSAAQYHHFALVVDDSAAIRKQLELELKDAGIGADFAETGEEALEKVAAKRYDLVFLDIIMPGIDGYETCRQMRIRADMKKTPIIMLSAKTSPLDEVQGVIAGASTYLTKPVKSEQLQKTLKRVSMWLDNFQVSA